MTTDEQAQVDPVPLSERYEDGLRIRREVLGDAHVDRSFGEADSMSLPLQQLVTESCWGAVWSRPGLDRRTRSLLTIAMLIALNRQQELQSHIRGALRNGCTPEEIREAILHSSAYCGFPASLDAMRSAQQVIRSDG
jgi:4-carboxymuconolactone decarboxylase